METNIDKAKKVSIKSFLNRLGIIPNQAGFLCCPIHKEKTASLKIYPETNSFNCFGCKASGDIIRLVELLFKCDAITAAGIILSYSNLPPSTQEAKPAQIQAVKVKDARINTKIYKTIYDLTELTDKGKSYLLSRALDLSTIELFRIKSLDNPAELFNQLLASYSREELKQAGLISEKGFFIFYLPAILFFHFSGNEIVYISTRNLEGTHKSTKLAGIPFEMFEIGSDKPEKIYIFESVVDAASFCQLFNISCRIVSCGGIPSKTHIERLRSKYCSEIILCLDNDDAGKRGALLFPELKSFNLGQICKQLKVKECKDFNELLINMKK